MPSALLTKVPQSLLRRRKAPSVPCTADDIATLRSNVHHLPVLVRSRGVARPLTFADAMLRLDASVWDLCRRFEVEAGPGTSMLSISQGLRRSGWTVGFARDALRAIEILAVAREMGDQPADRDIALSEIVGRLLGYLDLRAEFG